MQEMLLEPYIFNANEKCNAGLAFPLQAWRKYDTDRSGYIEANELKVGWAWGEGMEGTEKGTEATVAVGVRNLGREQTLGEEHGFVFCLGTLKPGSELVDMFRTAM